MVVLRNSFEGSNCQRTNPTQTQTTAKVTRGSGWASSRIFRSNQAPTLDGAAGAVGASTTAPLVAVTSAAVTSAAVVPVAVVPVAVVPVAGVPVTVVSVAMEPVVVGPIA